ncbi:YncE family protein [Nitrosomonas sp.]|uniref:YncE family protein n=1 Tax=Nitrosomonas sp. TaxID=42353 RepID=UPI001D656601|nr:YncE family protein [Nitrosomonas sp.]MBX3616531.1 YncE family protein [Nitrosomonas sp.]
MKSTLTAVLVCVLHSATTVFAIESLQAKTEAGGITIDFSLQNAAEPNQPGLGLASITVKDSISGRAYRDIKPLSWIVAKRNLYDNGELSCEFKAKQLMSGNMSLRADIDLNTYRIVTLNHDQTVAFINPFVSLNNAKLESIVSLPGEGFDWTYSPKLQRIYVTLRNQNTIAVIDTVSRKLIQTIAFDTDDHPTRMLLDEERQILWVGLDGRAQIAAIDLTANQSETQTKIERIPVGAGLHILATSDDQQWLFAINPQADTVSVINAVTKKHLQEIKVPGTPLAATWSTLAQRLAVITANSNDLFLIDPSTGKITTRIQLEEAGQALTLFNNGRNALVTNSKSSTITLIDLAMGVVKATAQITTGPDQIVLSPGYAYVRGQGSNNVSVINLREAAQGRLNVAQVPMGRLAPNATSEDIGVAPMIVPVPEGNGVIVANAADGMLYRYTEGLMAPSGNFSNYRRKARAVMIMDSGLTERGAGEYVAPVKFSTSGTYEVIVKTLSPSITACLPIVVNVPDSKPEEHEYSVLAVLLDSSDSSDKTQRNFRIALRDARQQTIAGIADGVLLVFHRTTGWQTRITLHEHEAGVYEASAKLPHSGRYELLVSVPSLTLDFTSGRIGSLYIETEVETTQGLQHAQTD